jgi:hypothetical protein
MASLLILSVTPGPKDKSEPALWDMNLVPDKMPERMEDDMLDRMADR